MKNISIDFRKLTRENKNSDWAKSILFVLFATVLALYLIVVYILLSPLDQNIKEIIDNQANESKVEFDIKTINTIKERRNIPVTPNTSSGKNPFLPY
jgi:uncharacterized protein YpmS